MTQYQPPHEHSRPAEPEPGPATGESQPTPDVTRPENATGAGVAPAPRWIGAGEQDEPVPAASFLEDPSGGQWRAQGHRESGFGRHAQSGEPDATDRAVLAEREGVGPGEPFRAGALDEPSDDAPGPMDDGGDVSRRIMSSDPAGDSVSDGVGLPVLSGSEGLGGSGGVGGSGVDAPGSADVGGGEGMAARWITADSGEPGEVDDAEEPTDVGGGAAGEAGTGEGMEGVTGSGPEAAGFGRDTEYGEGGTAEYGGSQRHGEAVQSARSAGSEGVSDEFAGEETDEALGGDIPDRLADEVAGLAELVELPVADHVERYDALHGELQDALASVDEV